MARILVVDDEQDLLWSLQHSLADEGYEVLTACDGVDALAVALHHHPDLIILDILMPQLDGIEVCHRLRREPTLAAVPILFLTVRGDIGDRVKGLDEGGDDYLVKPFDLGELKARVRALLRRDASARARSWGPQGRRSLVVGTLTLDLYLHQVRVGGRTMQLTPSEFALLRYLMIYPGEVFSSQQLLYQVWGYHPGTADPGLVRWHIKNLRTKIESDLAHPIYIRTIPHHGYILDAGLVSP